MFFIFLSLVTGEKKKDSYFAFIICDSPGARRFSYTHTHKNNTVYIFFFETFNVSSWSDTPW